MNNNEETSHKLKNGRKVLFIEDGAAGVIKVWSIANGEHRYERIMTLNDVRTGKCWRDNAFDIVGYEPEVDKLKALVYELSSIIEKNEELLARRDLNASKIQKVIAFVFRLVSFPVILVLMMLAYAKSIITLSAFYLVYGGEYMVYQKKHNLGMATFSSVIDKVLKDNK